MQEVKNEMKRQGVHRSQGNLPFPQNFGLSHVDGLFIEDHLLHYQGCYTGGTRMVHGGLSAFPKAERIPIGFSL